ncbi:NlpC/P60 family protein [Aquibacillus sediminis]|uniref:C40 family peptidase n=1 Tax=Aquibacillus sediminis TaxID=2574734 RepID=UPI00110824D9|nr:NlpC/P60 family protein [Aquibacillus sediminis]
MLTDANVQHVVKHSMAYGFALSQPFSFYVDAYPMLENKVIEDSKTLYYGQHNDGVRVLQQKLSKLSYFDKSIDGEFGVLTEYALKKFQHEHELTASGQADRATIITLITKEREKYLKPLLELEHVYQPGEKSDDIKKIQNALYYFGYYTEEIDGIFGPMTQTALKAFQNDYGIEIKNEIDEETIQRMVAAEQSQNETEQEQEIEHLTMNETEEQKNVPKVKSVSKQKAYDPSTLIKKAKQHIGTPYNWGGTSPNGFDCSGYIQYVFKEINIDLPRSVEEIWNATKPVDKLSVGDFVFYETYKPGPSHMGIYLGDHKFIHAGTSSGVEIEDMRGSYWEKRYLGAKRVVGK